DWVTDDGTKPDLMARNPIAATGGTEEESINSALARAAGDLQNPTRLGTRADIERIAKETCGVAVGRAIAIADAHPQFPRQSAPGAITVPGVPAAPPLSPDTTPEQSTAIPEDRGMLKEVADALDRVRLIGQEVYVCSPRYARVRVAVTLSGAVSDETRKAVVR